MSRAFVPLVLLWALLAGSLVEGKPVADECRACSRIVNFADDLVNYKGLDQLKDNLVDWCQESGYGSTLKMCQFLINDVIATLQKLGSDRFCSKIRACENDLLVESTAPPNPPSNDTSCEFCLNILTHIKGIVASEPTENELKEALSLICRHLGSFENECVKLIDQNLDSIFDYMRNRLDPQTICEECGSCPKKGDASAPLHVIEVVEVVDVYAAERPAEDVIPFVNLERTAIRVGSLPGSVECVLCQRALSWLYAQLESNATEQQIINALDMVCDKVFPLKERPQCERFVAQYTQEIINVVTQTADPELACALLSVCSAVTHEGDQVRVIDVERFPEEETYDADAVGGRVQCTLCKQVITWVIQKLKDNTTEPAIVKALDEVCDKVFPSSEKAQCEAFVQQYADEIINILKQENDPGLICALLGACTFAKDENRTKFKQNRPEEVTGSICECCLKATAWINERVQDNRSITTIVDALDQVCDIFVPKEKQQQCETYVQNQVDEIVDCLKNNTDPQTVCDKLKLCTLSDTALNPINLNTEREVEEPTSVETVSQKPNFVFCLVCKEAFEHMIKEIGENRTEAAIINALDKVCRVVYRKDSSQCEAAIAQYTDRFIYVLQNNVNPALACEMLFYCDKNAVGVERNEATEDFAKNEVDNNEIEVNEPLPDSRGMREDICYECEIIAHFIQEQLYNYNNEKTVDDWVITNICDRALNLIAKETCESFITEYGASIQQLIAMKVFDPTVFCQKETRLCPTTVSQAPPRAQPESRVIEPAVNPKLEFELIKPQKAEMCDLCIYAVTELDSLLTKDVITKEISQIASKVCNSFTDETKGQQCVDIINTYGPYILQMIGHMNNPRQVCKAVDICLIPGQVHLLGGHKCTFGPSYWCHTSAHAEACKATNFCQRKVWAPIA